MSALEEIGRSLAITTTKATEAQEAIVAAGSTWNQRGQELTERLSGTNDPNAQHLLNQHETTAEDMRQAWRKITLALRTIQRYRTSIEGEPAPLETPRSEAGSVRTSEPVKSPHGDSYPPQAAGLAEHLDKRVIPGVGEKTMGVGRFGEDGHPLPPMRSGMSEHYSQIIRERLKRAGVNPRWVDGHVEANFAALMIDSAQPHGELAINNVPCGIERQRNFPNTCDKALPSLLPEGYSLTVYGSGQDGSTFTKTYRGQGHP
ncbi:SCP1.201-like deaminase [Actinopolyspora xinjiangensis]|uniref:SCP1.201-like deaminase n=1 Tax=Actinopolyspora xinjiangensis TaxID=405564 RepID=A0A1H0W993_9ACTN|nr:DddA-like double-stranded DNA deaminase toxin [Actinopolyspora xinjiangensis]SDP87360.1 SCP1.201-like deaminase [Actinopolyspora xinjiangensis]